MTEDELYAARDAFARDFAILVRKHLPQYPLANLRMKAAVDSIDPTRAYIRVVDPHRAALLCMMQDTTSCYSPYVWSKEFDPK